MEQARKMFMALMELALEVLGLEPGDQFEGVIGEDGVPRLTGIGEPAVEAEEEPEGDEEPEATEDDEPEAADEEPEATEDDEPEVEEEKTE